MTYRRIKDEEVICSMTKIGLVPREDLRLLDHLLDVLGDAYATTPAIMNAISEITHILAVVEDAILLPSASKRIDPFM